MTDFRLAKHVTDMQIQKEIDSRMAQDAIRQKRIQDAKDKRDAAILIKAFVLCTLVLGFLGG